MLCAIYCRLSREDEFKKSESESIQNQKSLLIKYALDRGWDIYGIYCDEDMSGADRSRPDFIRLLNDAKAGKFDLILCKTQSRFTRDMELVERYIHGEFPKWGIRFVAVADNTDTEVKGSKKARQINGLVNEWYLEDLSENVRLVLDHKRLQGRYIGAFPLYGYARSPNDRNCLIPDPEAAEIVLRIFNLAACGMSSAMIAKELNTDGIPNPTKYKQLKGALYVNGGATENSGLWNRNTVRRMLQNEMYTGVMVQGRFSKVSYKSKKLISVPKDKWIRVEGTHPSIVPKDLFLLVQKRLCSKK